MSLSNSRSDKFASSRMIGCIDIVKEEFDRLLISFQVRFEKILSDKVKSDAGPADTSFHLPDKPAYEFC